MSVLLSLDPELFLPNGPIRPDTYIQEFFSNVKYQGCGSASFFNADPDPDSAFHFNADPDPAFHFKADTDQVPTLK